MIPQNTIMKEMTMNNQKEQILQVASQLFYEQGYKKTYLDQIAAICEITKPLISYYYKSKSSLARAVSDTFLFELKNKVALKLYTDYFKERKADLQVSTAVEIRLYNQMFLADPKAMRFLKELADDKYEDLFSQESIRLYKIHDRRYHLNINADTDELAMIANAARGASFSVLWAYDRGEFNCTQEDCLDYIARLNFVLMNVDKERIDAILAESKEVLKRVPFTFKPYFQIE
ncbi:TetR/AcrR family transcriptional regulator [Acetobacterium wieringae]|uniref:TetR/AcrR family transcriptional regulator n=1 Tax=Acetobacterium wieringae TaxID=52694 RepID=UPI0026ECAAE7|nr:TetR/AcrR family transcriptional regulator [Acetobacterium wieringae]